MDSTDRLKELEAKEHALRIFEERNKAFRILYDTVLEVEGASEQEVFSLLCKNLRRLCDADFTALASYDSDTNILKLEAISLEEGENPDLSSCRFLKVKLSEENLNNFKVDRTKRCTDHHKCMVELFSECISKFYKPEEGHKCYRIACVREGELLATGMIKLKPGRKLKMKDMVDTYLNLAGMILQRMYAVRSLKKSEESFRAIFETAIDSIFIKNIFGRYIKVNPAMQKLHGIPSSCFIGKTDEELFGEEVANQIWEVDAKVLEGKTVEEETSRQINANQMTLNIIKVPMYDNTNKIMGICGIARDITERTQMEQALINKNRELNDFTYRVSHDLKNPINLIKGYVMEINDNPNIFPCYFHRIIEQSDNLIQFINSLLSLSRAGRIIDTKEDIDLEMLIKQIFIPSRPHNVTAKLNLDLKIETIYGGPKSMEQVFTNLITNSIKYRDPAKEKLIIEVESYKNKNEIVIVFRDNGLGINSRNLERVFSPGFTEHQGKGTGFGLAIVKKIILAHDGDITIKSNGPKKGTVFTITLPTKSA